LSYTRMRAWRAQKSEIRIARACQAEARGKHPRLCPESSGAAAFSRFASEGWWGK